MQVPLLDATLCGRTLYARWYVEDDAAAGGYAVTDAVRFTVFGEPPPLFSDGFE